MLVSKSRTWVEIDLSKLKHNTKVVQNLIGNTKIMAVVKADAYGHGDIEIAKVLQEEMKIDYFCVSSIDEAITIRNAGISRRILILGYTPPMHFHYILEHSFTQCVPSLDYAMKLDAYAKENNSKIDAHIKIDTGMSRLGIPCVDDNYLIDDVLHVYQLNNLHIEGIFSHFSVSDIMDNEDDIAYTKHQIQLFDKVLNDIKAKGYDTGLTHIQNSYGCLNYFDLGYDYARPGLILIGSTSDNQIALRQEVDLKPILSWYANVSLVKIVKQGTYISYGRNFKANKEMKVATLSVGYADGLHRYASHQGMHVLIHGQRCPIIGNICMDQCLVDVTYVKDVYEGDVATIVGIDGEDQLYIDDLSHCANTINNESFCLISKRVPRFYER